MYQTALPQHTHNEESPGLSTNTVMLKTLRPKGGFLNQEISAHCFRSRVNLVKEDSPPGKHESMQYFLAWAVPTLDGSGPFPTLYGSSEAQAVSSPCVLYSNT